jgi:NADPH:quinone reductase-like Zn-dependent oxidoreductase
MYTQYRRVPADQCLQLPEGVTPKEGASSFVNPLTALGMVETMRSQGHTGLVHTAAASNLGQILNRLCFEEKVPLVNIVRKPEQEQILRALGAEYVLNSTSPTFTDELTEALASTSATLAFDAIGGGEVAEPILAGMEAAAAKTTAAYSTYGSATHKQVYIYGRTKPPALPPEPTSGGSPEPGRGSTGAMNRTPTAPTRDRRQPDPGTPA